MAMDKSLKSHLIIILVFFCCLPFLVKWKLDTLEAEKAERARGPGFLVVTLNSEKTMKVLSITNTGNMAQCEAQASKLNEQFLSMSGDGLRLASCYKDEKSAQALARAYEYGNNMK